MIAHANLKEALRSLYAAKQRTLLALIGIVIGIGSVIAMVSVGSAVQEESLRQFKEMGTDILSIEREFGGGDPGSSPTALNMAAVQGLASCCQSLGELSPYSQGGGVELSFGGRPLERASLMGATAAFLSVNKLQLSEGRFLSELDGLSQYAVVGDDVAQELLSRGARQVTGARLRLGDNIFTVVGSLQRIPQGGVRRFDPNAAILIPLAAALRQSSYADISVVNARVRPGFTNDMARDEIQRFFLSRTRSEHPGVRVSSPEDIIAQMEKQSQLFTLLLGAIGSISLVVGGVGVMNVMLVSVSERRREIGIRRALGARRSDIKGQFLIESLILSLLGGVLGVAMGVGTSVVICQFAGWPFQLSWLPIILGFFVSSVVGVFFGYYPARQASLLDPIVALRSD